MKERLRFPLFDTWKIANGSVTAGTVMDFFTTPKGATGSGFSTAKSELHTNLSTAGQMPYKVFRAVGLRVFAFTITSAPVTSANLNQLLNNSVITLKKEDRTILQVPLVWIPSGVGMYGQTTESTTTIVTNGMPVLSNIYRILPETYTQGDRIMLDITVKQAITIASVDMYLTVMMEGVVDKKF